MRRVIFVSIFILLAVVVSSDIYTTSGFRIASVAHAETEVERETRLRKELAAYEAELKQLNTQLGELNKQSASYTRDLQLLTTQITQAKTNIKAKTVTIQSLAKEIENKNKVITKLDTRIDMGRQSLGQLVRKTNELDSYNIVEVMLAKKSLSDVFEDKESFITIQNSMQELFSDIRDTKGKTEVEKEALRDKRNKELDAKAAIEESERQIAVKQREKNDLLSISRNQEAGYKAVIADKERKAAAIRTALFKLRDSEGIPFGTALEYANEASKATGVRAAFILGILKQESNLGVNVGQCFLTDTMTGAGKGKNTGTPFSNVMKPMNIGGRKGDVDDFLRITANLGLDPFTTPISCPQSIGYGGAMGPSQFIPSTWAGYEARVAVAMGVATANPWNAKHAFTATAFFVKDLGAGAGTYSAEREAAARYYAGGGWATYGLGYADSVLSHAAAFQTDIDFLKDVK